MKTSKKSKKVRTKKTDSKSTKSHRSDQVTPAFSIVTDPSIIAQFKSMFGSAGPGGFRLPKGTKWVELYTKPVPANWGPNRLRHLLKEEYQVDDKGRAFLFFNKAQDQLKLYFRDDEGDQIMSKILERGGFMFPAADSEQTFLKVSAKKLATLFRSS